MRNRRVGGGGGPRARGRISDYMTALPDRLMNNDCHDDSSLAPES